MADMVLVHDTSRPTTEAVIRDLLSTGDLTSAFSPVLAESDESAA